VNAPETSAMASSHIEIEPLNSISTTEFTELLVHVVRPGTRIVTNPNSKVLDFQGFTLVNLTFGNYKEG
jgi:hypothetical protein